MAKGLLTREQFIQRFGYDPEGGVEAAPAEPPKQKALLTRAQYIAKFGYDPESGPDFAKPMRPGLVGKQIDVPKPMGLDSFGMGVMQGATFGLADEAAAAARATMDTKGIGNANWLDTYRGRRTEERQKFHEAEEANKGAYIGGNLVGGLVTAPVAGAGALGTYGSAAAQGAAYGLGASEADLTKGEFGRAALDTAVGAGVGMAVPAAVAGVKRGIGAATRATKEAVGDAAKGILDRAKTDTSAYATEKLRAAQALGKENFEQAASELGPLLAKDSESAAKAALSPEVSASTAKKSLAEKTLTDLQGKVHSKTSAMVVGKEGVRRSGIVSTLETDRPLRAAIDESPRAGLDLVKKRLDKYGSLLEKDVYQRAEKLTPGAKLDDVLAPLEEIQARYAESGATRPLAVELANQTAILRDMYGDGIVPLQALRKQYRGWQTLAEKARDMRGELSPRAELANEMANAMRDVLHAEIGSAAEAAGETNLLTRLKFLNEKYSRYAGLRTLLSQAETLQAAGAPTGKQLFRDIPNAIKDLKGAIIGKGADIARAGAAKLQLSQIRAQAAREMPELTAASASPATPAVGTSTQALARLVNGVRTGSGNVSQLARDAIDSGVPSALVMRIVGGGDAQTVH